MSLVKKAFTNKVLHFILSRYVTYLLQFINSIFIAAFLGPYFLGIWGFFNLIVQYFAQINFGVSHAVNAIVAVNKDKKVFANAIFSNSISMLCLLSVIVFILIEGNHWFNWDIGAKYRISMFSTSLALIVILNYFIALLSNIHRIEGRLFEIAFSQSCQPVLNLLTIMFFKGEQLLEALVLSNLISFVLSAVLLVYKNPYRFRFDWNFILIKKIFTKGWYLFIYNSSFYLIIISTRTVISTYYTVSDFGYFTFAFTLANVILLLFQSFASLIFPKVLNRLSKASIEEGKKFLDKIRGDYIGLSHLFGHLAIVFFPAFLFFFPKYISTLESFRLIVLAMLLNTNSFGYQGLLIAKGKEKLLGFSALVILILNIVIAASLVHFDLPYQFVIFSTIISYFVYIFIVGIYGRKILSIKNKIINLIDDVFPFSMLIPFFISLVFTISGFDNTFFIVPILLFLLFNHNNLKNTIITIKTTILKPDIINID